MDEEIISALGLSLEDGQLLMEEQQILHAQILSTQFSEYKEPNR